MAAAGEATVIWADSDLRGKNFTMTTIKHWHRLPR